MSDIYRKAEFWDRFLAVWEGMGDESGDEDINLDELHNLTLEYHRRPRLDGTWCGACDKMDGHAKDQCPERPVVEKFQKTP